MAIAEPPVLEVSGVTFGYDREAVLVDVNLRIDRHDFLAVIGPNGGGKTTLLRVVLGLEQPWQGQVRWNLPGRRRAGRIGYVPQFSTFDRNFPLSLRDAVIMGRVGRLGLFGRYRADDHKAVDAILERLRLSHLAGVPIADVSGGQLQRALIGRALVADPDILLLDEPTSSVDAETRLTLSELLSDLNRRIPIVVVTHDVTGFATQVRQIACVNRRLYYHSGGQLSHDQLEEAYGCPVELIAHGVPHRVLAEHPEGG